MQIKKAQPPLSLHGQVLWREFFYCAATNNLNFDRMVGNPICVQIPWDKNNEALAKWANVRSVSSSRTVYFYRPTLELLIQFIDTWTCTDCMQILSELCVALHFFNVESFSTGPNWFSLDRRDHDAATRGRVDSPLGASCRRVFPHQRRLVDILGRRNEGHFHLNN